MESVKDKLKNDKKIPNNESLFFCAMFFLVQAIVIVFRQKHATMQIIKKYIQNYKMILVNLSSFIQSSAYAILNYNCLVSVLSASLPISYVIAPSAILAIGLFIGELTFNIEQVENIRPNISKAINKISIFKLFSKKICNPQEKPKSIATNTVLLGLIVLNSLANGLIAMGDFKNISSLVKYSIIGNGILVSISTMLNSYYADNTSDDSENSDDFLPSNESDRQKLFQSISQTILSAALSYGLFTPSLKIHYPKIQKNLVRSCTIALPFTIKTVRNQVNTGFNSAKNISQRILSRLPLQSEKPS